jgi:Uma2 family endonuclease
VWLLVLSRDAADLEHGNVASPVLEVYRRPSPDGYTEIRLVRRGERIAPEALPDVELAADELFGE